jgi:serine/threonine-protein kinase
VENDTPGAAGTTNERLEGRLLTGRYRLENIVSWGANTIIAEAIDVRDDSPVTVKIVRPELAMQPSFRDAFTRRVAVAQSLSHPNIARVLDSGEFEIAGETTLFWVVEYLGGGSLRDLYDRGRLLEPSQALVVGLEASRALEVAHGRGVVHTELTPSKMVFGEDARIRIVDFAMAELMGAEAWTEPATVATHVARYASPEQALGLDVDAKTDVYALSLCLIEGITGKVPFAGESTVSTLAARVGKLMPVTADMGSLAAVLERAGRPEAEDRWTAAEFGNALVQAAGKLPRPDPIPIMASTLFGTSMVQRRADETAATAATTDTDVEATVDVDTDVGAGVGAGVDVDVGADVDVGTDVEEASSTPITVPADDVTPLDDAPVDGNAPDAAPGAVDGAAPLILLTDIADPPTGAVQVADHVGPTPDTTAQLPAAVAAAAAVATAPGGPSTATETGAETTTMDVVDGTPSGTLYDAERESTPWGKYVGITLLVLVGVAALGAAAFFLLRTKSYEVPDLVGVDEAVAINEVSGNGWVIETERERSDEVPEVDHVVRTTPAAGEMLDEGETLVLVVSDGPELRTIPEFAGMALVDAQTSLADLSLQWVETAPEYSETVPAGSVIRWQVQDDSSLVAGAQVLPGTTIVLTASLGPEPRPAPDLTNQTLEEATATLAGLQLAVAQGEDEFSNDIEIGRVVSQDPPPTTPVARDAAVTVRLSKGPDLVAFPDLSGQTYPQAQQTLADAGYTVNSLLGTTEGTFVSASVDGDEVEPGATFPRGTGVDLIFL